MQLTDAAGEFVNPALVAGWNKDHVRTSSREHEPGDLPRQHSSVSFRSFHCCRTPAWFVRQIPIPIASRSQCKHLPRMTPGFGAGLVIPICGNRRQYARCNREKDVWCRRHRIGQDLHLRAALSDLKTSGGVHRSRPAHSLTINIECARARLESAYLRVTSH